MIISKLHYISQGNTPEAHLENIQKACTSGAELVQLHLSGISEAKYLEIAKAARDITFHFQTRLIINGNYNIAKEVKAEGVHLEKTDVCSTVARPHLYSWQIIGGSANSLEDCEALLAKDIDYIKLEPFRTTTEDSSSIALGLDGYTTISNALITEKPIIGFGDITTNDVTDILETGISGIAVSDAITENFDNIKTFNQLLKASATGEIRHTFK
ncbi:thiamine phosphate synthase [Winogradskyella psychrotolerans]|uniref:thiamine phosphate synthase n=1 Tax=Winogradskyella psychrotolerans TaxID=1344585 RepID=UPI001C0736FA|nr:thiamine phosphate synthase [Winogradskyella psychrotolerans]MBU2929309.1 thiamine phosphate synthase [Winogradskyella psychrotolerans]